MNCPNCKSEMTKTTEECWTGKYNNVLSVVVFWDCPQCGYQTDSTEGNEPSELDEVVQEGDKV